MKPIASIVISLMDTDPRLVNAASPDRVKLHVVIEPDLTERDFLFSALVQTIQGTLNLWTILVQRTAVIHRPGPGTNGPNTGN